jgi:hypothetical protein
MFPSEKSSDQTSAETNEPSIDLLRIMVGTEDKIGTTKHSDIATAKNPIFFFIYSSAKVVRVEINLLFD